MTVAAQNVEKMRSDYNGLAAKMEAHPETHAVLMPVLENCVALLFTELAKLDAHRAAVVEKNRAARPHECPRCNGRGHFKGFAHVQGGVCFKCNGTGKR